MVVLWSPIRLLKSRLNLAVCEGRLVLHVIQKEIDYEGQARSEKWSRIIITIFAIIGLVWGYVIQQYSQTVYTVGVGFLLAALITLPPWPMYRRHPLNWQKPRDHPEPSEHGSSKKSKKK